MNKLSIDSKDKIVGVITLKEIIDLINPSRKDRGASDIQHSKAMVIVENMVASSPSFGVVSNFDTVNLNGLKVETYLLNRNQAIAVGGKLDTERLMLIVKRVDELERKSVSESAMIPTYLETAKQLATVLEENQLLQSRIERKDEIILDVADLNIKAGDVSVDDFSKNLAIPNMGRNKMYAWMKGNKYLMKNNTPYQKYVKHGYMIRKPSDEKHNGKIRYTTYLTPKGTIWLTGLLKKEFDLPYLKSISYGHDLGGLKDESAA